MYNNNIFLIQFRSNILLIIYSSLRIMISSSKKLNLFIILLSIMLIFTAEAGRSPCPTSFQTGSIFSAHITVSTANSLILFEPGYNSICYNYTLPYDFKQPPNAALAIDGFNSQQTDDLYFAVKPVVSDSVGFIPLIVRTYWKFTRWTQVSFYLLVEDRADIQAGYYQIDTGKLGGCERGKQIYVFVPFRQTYSYLNKINHSLFLSGFQVSPQTVGEYQKSPFQIFISESATNSSGLLITFQVTTVTQIHAVHINYVIHIKTSLSIVTGSYVYEYKPGFITHTPAQSVGRNYARIHGITGFIINNLNQEINFDAKWTGVRFQFTIEENIHFVQYFSYQYIFFIGSQCENCHGYPIYHNGKCLQSCPIGTYQTSEQVCIDCGQGRYWNGTACVKSCPQGQYLDYSTNQCVCAEGTYWTGTICISCTQGRIFNPVKLSCQCPINQIWNGAKCQIKISCTQGKIWSVFSYACQCPIGTYWNGTFCYIKILCNDGRILNKQNQCVCPLDKNWNGKYCEAINCQGGQSWNGSACICPYGLNFNGTYCLECINGQLWNPIQKSCNCQYGNIWNGNFCEKSNICTGGRIWSTIYKQCICENNSYWNGAQCVLKPTCCCGKRWDDDKQQCECDKGFHWDGKTCVQCMNGKIWDDKSKQCICQVGTQWNSQFCVFIQTCYGGMIWNQNTWSCECPSTTVWSNGYCIANPCFNGQVWDQSIGSCICAGGKIYYNGYCVPPQIQCTGGRYWDPKTYACKCQQWFWFDGNNCVPMKKCKGNQIYNPRNNQCQCPSGLIWLQSKNSCGDPTCPIGKMWDGNGCVQIQCPPNSFYNGTQCICLKKEKCEPWQYFDGQSCKYYQNKCYNGTQWKNQGCIPIDKSCPQGNYKNNNGCTPIPQLCPAPCIFQNSYSACKCPGNLCPTGTYLSGKQCLPYKECSKPQIFSKEYLQCRCPNQTQYSYNGQTCLSCPVGKVWIQDIKGGKSCKCPPNHFEIGQRCQPVTTSDRCKNIPNSQWNQKLTKCVCLSGFSVVGLQCICQGVVSQGRCQRCSQKPNSDWKYGICQCIEGFFEQRGKCIKRGDFWGGKDSLASCAVATYFDEQQKRCLACPNGCLSCTDCYTCLQCRSQFNLNHQSRLCTQHCGDGKKFVAQCDDGNNVNGDGCSLDCKIQQGYTCRGGSPTSKDSCIIYDPEAVTITQVGQVRYSKSIILNIKVDYMPKSLLQSLQCQDRCSNVINGKIISGDGSVISIKSTFIPGTTYSFSMQINFGKPYIGQFTIQVSINSKIGQKYFGKVKTNKNLIVKVVPGYLAKIENDGSNILI